MTGSIAAPSYVGDDDRDVVFALWSMAAGVQLEFTAALQQIAEETQTVLTAADGVGVTYLEDGRVAQLTSTNAFAADVDDVQYGLMEGPCVTAVGHDRVLLVPSLDRERRWPQFRDEVAGMDVHSVMSIPLTVTGRTIATLNVYAREEGVLDSTVAGLGEEYAPTAARALQRACVLRQGRRLLGRLDADLTRSRTVNRAVGLIMSLDGVTQSDALAALQSAALRQQTGVAEAAQAVWDDREPRRGFLDAMRSPAPDPVERP